MKGVTEELPFGPETLVYKVMGKMFALTSLNDFTGFNIKVVPELGPNFARDMLKLRRLIT